MSVAGIDPKKAPAPPLKPQAPTTPVEKLKVLIDPTHWHLLQNLLNWAIIWENTAQGKVTPFSKETKMVMLAPWRAFDSHPRALQSMGQFCTGAFLSAYNQYEADEIYRQANPMPWIVLQVVAPAFAQVCSNTPEAAQAAWKIIMELRKIDELPLEPANPTDTQQPGKS